MTAASFNELFGLGSHSPDANLEGWWPLMDNAASTTVLDYSGHGRHGTAAANTNGKTTTGPNSWLTAALDFNGTSDLIRYATFPNLSALTVGLYIDYDDEETFNRAISTQNDGGTLGFLMGRDTSSATKVRLLTPAVAVSSSDVTAAGGWKNLIGRYTGSVATIWIDGVLDATTSGGGSLPTNRPQLVIGADHIPNAGDYTDGQMAGVYIFSRALADSEIGQSVAGPEPIVVSGSDSVSGTEQEGETLSASGATWGLDAPFAAGSNGTITYTYQWTRSDDGSGTNEADISGATSSTYTLQSADVGKYIRRRTRASNDGGYDAAADHYSSFTGAIASAGGTGNRRRRLLLCGVAA